MIATIPELPTGYETLTTQLNSIKTEVSTLTTALEIGLKTFGEFDGVFDTIGDYMINITVGEENIPFDEYSTTVSTNFSGMVNTSFLILSKINTDINGAITKINSLSGSPLTVYLDSLVAVMADIDTLIGNVSSNLQDAVDSVVSLIQTLTQNLVNGLRYIVAAETNTISDSFIEISSGISTTIDSMDAIVDSNSDSARDTLMVNSVQSTVLSLNNTLVSSSTTIETDFASLSSLDSL